MNKLLALELYDKFSREGSFSKAAGDVLFGTGLAKLSVKRLAKAWPYGTLFAAVLLISRSWYYTSLANRIKDTCLPGGGDQGIEYIQKFIRAPSGVWDKVEESYRDEGGIDRRIGRVILAIPATCRAWNGGKPW